MAGVPTFEDQEFIEVLQALAADLLTRDEARDVLRMARPEWFPTTKAAADPTSPSQLAEWAQSDPESAERLLAALQGWGVHPAYRYDKGYSLATVAAAAENLRGSRDKWYGRLA